MDTCLYLDTARLGQMCPEAQQADHDFARLAGDEAGSLYYDHFLRGGRLKNPPRLRRRYPGLAGWSGVRGLKSRIQTALRLSSQRPMLLANRTAQLVRLASRALCTECENVLVTDMLWPAYREILEAECRRAGRALTTVPLHSAVLNDQISQEELIGRTTDAYHRQDCDGLFLGAVTYQGIRIPVGEIVQAAAQVRRPRFVVVDAAQAVNHVPLGAGARCCDFMIAGCHKWLRAYHPMGLGFCCRPAADEVISNALGSMTHHGELDDPLLRFSWGLETGTCAPFSETVNLGPLFTAAAAVSRIWRSGRGRCEEFSLQLANTDRVADLVRDTPWRPVRPVALMRSGILMLQARRTETRTAPPDALRFAFRRCGFALSTYVGGLIRASFHPEALTSRTLSRLHLALKSCG